MKSLKVLACAACLLGTVSGVGFAKDVQTIAGSMVVPNNVNVVSASKTNTRDFVEKQLNENPSKSSMANMMAKELLQNFGTTFDVYQLKGADKTGQKDALVVAVDVKQIAQQVAKDKTNDPMFVAAMAALDKGQIDPVTEQLMLGAINKQIPTTTTVVPLNDPKRYANLKTRSGELLIKPRTLTVENAEPTKSSMANMMVKEFFQNFGTNFDVYQLQGADKTGQKDAFVVAVDVKQIAQQVAKDKTNDPMFMAAMAALDKGQIDPVTEQLMLGAVNKQIPTTTTVVPLNDPKRYANLKTRSGELLIKPRTLTVENAEQVHPVAGTKYQTYAASSRLLYADGDGQTPLYANAAFVLKPGKPVLYIGVTTDVQRDYFKTIFDNAFKSIK